MLKRTRAKIALAIGTIIAAGTITVGASGSAASDEADPKFLAQRAAEANEESKARNVEWVETTRGEAVAFMSGAEEIPDETPVFVVSLEGKFKAKFARRPPGALAPTGSHILLVADRKTGEVYAGSLRNNPTSLAPLGESKK